MAEERGERTPTAREELARYATRSPEAAALLADLQEHRQSKRPQDPGSPTLAAVELIAGAATALDGHWHPNEVGRMQAVVNLILELDLQRMEHAGCATIHKLLEEAAEVAESFADRNQPDAWHWIAAAIRALRPSPVPTQSDADI